MPNVKGILSFPALFQPKTAQGASEAKFSCTVLIAPGDPQIAALQAEVEQAKLNGFPNGYTGADECYAQYDVKYAGKDYYDPRFAGWYVFSCSAKADDRPVVVDENLANIIDPALVYAGATVEVHAGLSAYTKGKGGIGGWLNGVKVYTQQEAQMGRLDSKPTKEQMFGGGAPATPTMTNNPVPPIPAPPIPAPPAPAATGLIMTAAANGMTYEQYKTAGWTDEQMIAGGVAQKPSFA